MMVSGKPVWILVGGVGDAPAWVSWWGMRGCRRAIRAARSARCPALGWGRAGLDRCRFGCTSGRPALVEMLAVAAAGDTVVVSRLDRLGAVLAGPAGPRRGPGRRDVGVRSLAEQIDTTSATGRLVLHVFGALADSSVP